MRLPFDPVLPALPYVHGPDGLGPSPTVTNAARTFSVGHPRIRRWMEQGVTVDEADMIAGVLRRHPSELWAEWADALEEQVRADLDARGVVCALDGCDERYLQNPRHPRRYCSKDCAAEAKRRRNRVPKTETVCEADGCAEVFVPKVTVGPTRQRYCSGRCEHRMTMRTYRATERGRESNRRARRKYEEEVREIKRRRRERQRAA